MLPHGQVHSFDSDNTLILLILLIFEMLHEILNALGHMHAAMM